MTTGLSYDGSTPGTDSYLDLVAAMAVVSPTNVDFLTVLPGAITYAENRIARDLDLLIQVEVNSTFTTTPSIRSLSIPASAYVTIQQVNIITPVGTALPDSGTRVPLIPVSKEFLDAVYPSVSGAGVPAYFTMLSQYMILMGPWPSGAFTVELVGTTRAESLASTNQTTFISLYLPDLLVMASMVFLSAYQRNFSGLSANDPQMPISYESQYQTLLKGATVEEARKKFQASGWTSMSPPVVASSGRG